MLQHLAPPTQDVGTSASYDWQALHEEAEGLSNLEAARFNQTLRESAALACLLLRLAIGVNFALEAKNTSPPTPMHL